MLQNFWFGVGEQLVRYIKRFSNAGSKHKMNQVSSKKQKGESKTPTQEAKGDKTFMTLLKQDELTASILRGDPQAAVQAEKKSVRLFVSSTYTDAEPERNYLMREVYPSIRQLCLDNGVDFR